MKRYRTAIILVVVFAALLAVVVLTQPGTPQATVAGTPTASAADQKLQIIKLPDNNGPTRFEVKQADPAKSIAFKLDGNWKLEGQEAVALDTGTVASTINQFSTLKGTQLIEEKLSNAALVGLDKPSLVITLTTPSFTKTLQVGITNTATGNYYVKLADQDQVWAVSPTLINQVKDWLTPPPVAPPTPTPLPTLPPSPTPLPTVAVSGTPGTPGAASTPAPTTAPATTTTPPPTPTS